MSANSDEQKKARSPRKRSSKCDECQGGWECSSCNHHVHRPGKCLVINCMCRTNSTRENFADWVKRVSGEAAE